MTTPVDVSHDHHTTVYPRPLLVVSFVVTGAYLLGVSVAMLHMIVTDSTFFTNFPIGMMVLCMGIFSLWGSLYAIGLIYSSIQRLVITPDGIRLSTLFYTLDVPWHAVIGYRRTRHRILPGQWEYLVLAHATVVWVTLLVPLAKLIPITAINITIFGDLMVGRPSRVATIIWSYKPELAPI